MAFSLAISGFFQRACDIDYGDIDDGIQMKETESEERQTNAKLLLPRQWRHFFSIITNSYAMNILSSGILCECRILSDTRILSAERCCEHEISLEPYFISLFQHYRFITINIHQFWCISHSKSTMAPNYATTKRLSWRNGHGSSPLPHIFFQ